MTDRAAGEPEQRHFTLRRVDAGRIGSDVTKILVAGEKVALAFVTPTGEYVLLTDLRMLRVRVVEKRMLSARHVFWTLPWARVRTFTVSTADEPCIDLWLEDLLPTRLAFVGKPGEAEAAARVIGAGVLRRS